MFLGLVAAVLAFAASANAQGGAYAQCGGIGWSGATTCVSGYACAVVNPYYSQCLPGTAAPSSPTSSPSTPTSSTAGGTPSSTTVSAPAPTGSQIRSDQDPAYHLYLQDIAGAPVLGPEASSGYFTIGSTITLNNADGTKLYLNIDTNVTTSYLPLSLDSTAKTTTWGLSGDTIIYGSQQNFVVCPISGSTNYNLYLSTANDMPSTSCTNYITIHLPCLC